MVPNHMGINSRWVIEHPDWFISLNYSPFPPIPSTALTSPGMTGWGFTWKTIIYNNSDAAVVFKRVDNWTGSEKLHLSWQ